MLDFAAAAAAAETTENSSVDSNNVAADWIDYVLHVCSSQPLLKLAKASLVRPQPPPAVATEGAPAAAATVVSLRTASRTQPITITTKFKFTTVQTFGQASPAHHSVQRGQRGQCRNTLPSPPPVFTCKVTWDVSENVSRWLRPINTCRLEMASHTGHGLWATKDQSS